MFDLSDIIDRIDYTIDRKEYAYYLEDQQDINGTELIVYLLSDLRLFDYTVELDDSSISIEQVDATLRYKVTFNFSKLDVATGDCEYTHNVRFDYAFIDSLSDHEDLEDLVISQIENNIIFGGKFKPRDLMFKPVLKKLQ